MLCCNRMNGNAYANVVIRVAFSTLYIEVKILSAIVRRIGVACIVRIGHVHIRIYQTSNHIAMRAKSSTTYLR